MALDAYDEESGIHKITYRFVNKGTGELLHEGLIPGNKSDKVRMYVPLCFEHFVFATFSLWVFNYHLQFSEHSC